MTKKSAVFDIKVSGPGMWFMIHFISVSNRRYFPTLMRDLANNFPCPTECKPHLDEFMDKNDLSEYENFTMVYEEKEYKLGYLYWSFILHNSVNERLSKPIVEFGEVIKSYIKYYK